uniref:Apple domain-containing protein n=1 Tax=Panagrellus redivivus TaxID=6233 RepID=A0A7E4UQP7_PANRE
MWVLSIVAISYCAIGTFATTEWFGDLRASLNPARAPAFYDVTYDDIDCPEGLQSNAIPDYVYFGAMIATMTVKEHTECLQHCLSEPTCQAVNFFEPMSYQEKGFCELLKETQFDNPRLMRPFRKAVYYEKLRCRNDEDGLEPLDMNNPERPVVIASTVFPKASTEKHTISRVPEARTASGSTEAPKPDAGAVMKRLEAKVHEFNLRFRS